MGVPAPASAEPGPTLWSDGEDRWLAPVLQLDGAIFWQHDDLLGWTQIPGAEGIYVGPRPWPVEFRSPVAIDSRGLRGPELAPLPPGGYRIVMLGDSLVAGFEVAWTTPSSRVSSAG